MRDRHAARLANKSLGLLVDKLFESYVITGGSEPADVEDESNGISMAFRMNVQMAEADRERLQQSIEELVVMTLAG